MRIRIIPAVAGAGSLAATPIRGSMSRRRRPPWSSPATTWTTILTIAAAAAESRGVGGLRAAARASDTRIALRRKHPTRGDLDGKIDAYAYTRTWHEPIRSSESF
jgi:hypothetical protein